ncbi:unnamed protein product [Pylaiella littoralis]
MADQDYPHHVHTAELEADGSAVHADSFSSCVLEHHTARTREFAPAACRVVSSVYCECVVEPQPMKDFTQREERRVAARQHPGTCGVAMAGLIAAGETEDVRQTASRRQQEATFKSFRNQACYEAARTLNVRGAGIPSPSQQMLRESVPGALGWGRSD